MINCNFLLMKTNILILRNTARTSPVWVIGIDILQGTYSTDNIYS